MSSMGDHFVTKCRACGSVVNQCRCPDPNKRVEWVEQCQRCAKGVSNILSPAWAVSPSDYESVLDAMKTVESGVPVLAGRIRIIVDKHAKPGDEPTLICSQAYAYAINRSVPETEK
jgi:hypothetical protein